MGWVVYYCGDWRATEIWVKQISPAVRTEVWRQWIQQIINILQPAPCRRCTDTAHSPSLVSLYGSISGRIWDCQGWLPTHHLYCSQPAVPTLCCRYVNAGKGGQVVPFQLGHNRLCCSNWKTEMQRLWERPPTHLPDKSLPRQRAESYLIIVCSFLPRPASNKLINICRILIKTFKISSEEMT